MTLYQLLMEERYGQAIERGLLWYLNEASPEVVSQSPYEVPSRSFFPPCWSGSTAYCWSGSARKCREPCHVARLLMESCKHDSLQENLWAAWFGKPWGVLCRWPA